MLQDEEKQTQRRKGELHNAVDTMHGELTRVEIMTAAMAAFSQPIPDYEQNFHHLRHLTASAAQLKSH